MNAKVLFAVFRRNFVSYFSNPTGYAFICVFVVLSSVAAFLPSSFFNQNLANLAQLNIWFPLIMLVFIPAITMSMWAEERRQGTDELLLTIPAGDFEIVLGKYLAAIAIFSALLVFSFFCNLLVLEGLGSPDWGLFISTYVGYGLVGLLMLAIGMVASFLTGNLTVAYILGAIFNTPLVVMVWAKQTSLPSMFSKALGRLSIGGQMEDFGRGLVGLAPLIYFVGLAMVMVYLSMVLIARRHWAANRRVEGGVHFSARVVCLLIAVLSLVIATGRLSGKLDVTSEQINSLSPITTTLVKDIEPDHTVEITAFLSPEVPEDYVKTRLDIVNVLREIEASAGDKVRLEILDTKPFTENARLARTSYGITPRPVQSRRADVPIQEEIFLGVAFRCGLGKPITLQFIDRGVPVEYELVRSICTVTQQDRKKIGVLRTAAGVFGQPAPPQMMMMGQQGRPPWRIIAELEKMYDVVEVDPSSPIRDEFDALLAVQPSAMSPEEFTNFMQAVQRGIPTAIFEDPCPAMVGVPGTSEELTPPQSPMMMQQQQTQPKGDISELFDFLEVDVDAQKLVRQSKYNPYPTLREFPEEFTFVDVSGAEAGLGKYQPFNPDDAVTSSLQNVIFPFGGVIEDDGAGDKNFTPLVRTVKNAGTVQFDELFDPMSRMFGQPRLDPNRTVTKVRDGETSYIMAARVKADLADLPPLFEEPTEGEDGDDEEKEKKEREEVHVIIVSDIDLLSDPFFVIRERDIRPDGNTRFDFDNVTFLLNVLDSLADDDRFLELRKRRPKHRTLDTISRKTEEARNKAEEEREAAIDGAKKIEEEQTEKLREDEEKLREQLESQNLSPTEVMNRLSMSIKAAAKRADVEKERVAAERDEKLDRIETELQDEISQVQDWYKVWAVLLPPMTPLFIGIVVFFWRRSQENVGMSAGRRRK